MISTTNHKTLKKRTAGAAAGRILAAAFWVAVWQAVYLCARQEILIASPVSVIRRVFELAGQTGFWMIILGSMRRVLEGFATGTVLGLLLAVMTFRSSFLNRIIYPAVSVMKATPVASFIILALVWVRSEMVPVFAEVVIVTPIVWENVSKGLKKTDLDLLQMARVFQFGGIRTILRIYVPSVMPYFMASCAASIGLAWKGGVAAEVLANLPYSMGGKIYKSKIYLETADLFAWTIVVILLSILLEKGMVGILRKTGKKYNTGG